MLRPRLRHLVPSVLLVAAATGCWTDTFHVDTLDPQASSASPGHACGRFTPTADGNASIEGLSTTADTAFTAYAYVFDTTNPNAGGGTVLVWFQGHGNGSTVPVRAGNTYVVVINASSSTLFNTDLTIRIHVQDSANHEIAVACQAT
jgi:hypothetical protein